MSVDRRYQEMLTELSELREQRAASRSIPVLHHFPEGTAVERGDFPPPAASGNGGGMDGRLAKIEDSIVELKVDVATLKENVRHLPTKGWMFTALASLLTAVAGIVTLAVRFVPQAG